MTAKAIPPWQILTVEITAFCLLVFTVGFGLLHLFTRWELGGADLIVVGSLIISYVSVFRFRLSQASARIDELEKKLATSGTTDV
jgi:hypothetical protein